MPSRGEGHEIPPGGVVTHAGSVDGMLTAIPGAPVRVEDRIHGDRTTWARVA